MDSWNDFIANNNMCITTHNNETKNIIIVDDNARLHQSVWFLSDDELPPPLQHIKSITDYIKIRRRRILQQKRQVMPVVEKSSSSFGSTYTDLMLEHRQIGNVVGMNSNNYYSEYKQALLERKPILRYALHGQNRSVRLTDLSTVMSTSVQKQQQQQQKGYYNRKINGKDNIRVYDDNDGRIPITISQERRIRNQDQYGNIGIGNSNTITEEQVKEEEDSSLTLRMKSYCSPQA